MLTNVEVFGVSSTPLELPLADSGPGINPFQHRGHDGLGPVKADITTSPYAEIDGEAFLGDSVGKRNIVLKIGLNPDWADQTMEGLRMLLYAYFMPKFPVRLRFTSTHLPTCEISGYVESMDPNMFSKDPEINVSIICPSPHFVAVTPTVVNGVATNGGAAPPQITYEGSVPTGMTVEVHSSAAVGSYTGNLTIRTGVATVDSFVLPVTVDAANFFRMNSVPGAKSVKSVAVASGAETSLLGRLPAAPIWPSLWPGLNSFDVSESSAGQTWILSYFARFGGL